MSKIAVHIVTYNSVTTLPDCLAALRAQTVEYDLFVVDNASTDGTVELLREQNVPHVASPINLGYPAAHNLALKHTVSDYVLTLNPDVALMPDFIEKLARLLDENPDYGAAAGSLIRVENLSEPISEGHTLDGAGLFMRRTRRQGLRMEGKPVRPSPPDPLSRPCGRGGETDTSEGNSYTIRDLHYPPDNANAAPTPIFGPDGAAAFYRRAMLDDIAIDGEVFDADFFMHREDIDLCWRMQRRGWSAWWHPDAWAKHIRTFRPGQRARVNDDLRRLTVRNRYLLLIKNDAPLWWELPSILAYDLGILLFVLLRERESLRAYPDAWRLLGKMLDKRRAIRAGARVTPREMARWFGGES